jgi:Zn-dependent peptidase ImmA (M78 family)
MAEKHLFQELAASGITQYHSGWKDFSIKIIKNLKSDSQKLYGEVDFDKGILSLEKDMDDTTARHTLLHEVCHILLETVGLGGPEEGVEDSLTTSNETLTEGATRGMLMFKNLNPELWRILWNE